MYSSLFLYLRPPMSVPVLNGKGEKVSSVELPLPFRVPVREDLIKRVFLSEFTARLQPKGRDPLAGKRTTAESLGIGYGVARVPRIKDSRRAAFIGFAVGGMATHPPRVEKRIHERVNRKERVLGTMSALAATADVELVRGRGHSFSAEAVPVVVDSAELSSIAKAKQAVGLLKALGVFSDVERAYEGTRWRAGRGKMRGRRYKEPRGPLVILEDHRSPAAVALRNLPGVEVVTPRTVSVLHLAPGGVPGRLTLISSGSIALLADRFKVNL
ncbi:MAG: 50S ribosomal protein L4 [Acidilobaceae archaeon]|nr:50S ribosomal protein L4 [Acidilobaceae archaeon]MCX8165692.1 50S ribosomal protein L4 [Acidilobaceae archaeon]MDW7974117.1 50S ribosomal protein L4 [Sulfolobales archaeon]